MTCELCSSGSFSLIFSDHCGSSITELTESQLYTREDERMYTHTPLPSLISITSSFIAPLENLEKDVILVNWLSKSYIAEGKIQ